MWRGDYLPPKVLQVAGLLMAFGFAIFWAATGRLEPLLLAFAGGLIGGGIYSDAARQLRDKPVPPELEARHQEHEERDR